MNTIKILAIVLFVFFIQTNVFAENTYFLDWYKEQSNGGDLDFSDLKNKISQYQDQMQKVIFEDEFAKDFPDVDLSNFDPNDSESVDPQAYYFIRLYEKLTTEVEEIQKAEVVPKGACYELSNNLLKAVKQFFKKRVELVRRKEELRNYLNLPFNEECYNSMEGKLEEDRPSQEFSTFINMIYEGFYVPMF